jgi:hypothetical protein
MNASVSAAALARAIGDEPPATIILDEADATFSKGARHDESTDMLRGILNAGFQRGRPYKRFNAGTGKVEDHPTFAFAILAGIGDLPDTIEDRAIIVVLRRKAAEESVARYRIRRDAPVAQNVGRQLGEWVSAHAKEIGAAEPEFPDGLNDRQEDAWEPLLAIADRAGGDWPERARRAAVALCTEAEEEASEGRRLLRDLKDVFGERDKMFTADILTGLKSIEEAPWGAIDLTALQLSRMLKPYGVKPAQVRIGSKTTKGYEAAGLQDAWTRYVARLGGQPETGETGETLQVNPVSGCFPVSPPDTETRNRETRGNALTSDVSSVSGVSPTPSVSGQPVVGENAIATGSSYIRHGRRCAMRGCGASDLDEYDGETYCGRHAKTVGLA